MEPETYDDGTFRHEADVRKMAAAPEMLKALEAVRYGPTEGLYEKVIGAIAKAKGAD